MVWKIVLFAALYRSLSAIGVDALQIPKSSFSCDGRTSGYYADVSTGCQVYHMCDGLGRQFSYRCPSKTLFQQRMLICDHWYMVNCSKAEEDYSANLLIGQKGKAFVDLQYHRTPRPDLADPSNSDYNMYQTGQAETRSTKNVVGADEDEDAQLSTDDPKYSPPSHWSIDVSARPTTPTPTKRQERYGALPAFAKQSFYRTNYNTGNKFSNDNAQPKAKKLDLNSVSRYENDVNVGVASKAKATKDSKGERAFQNRVNFPSRFKATTPVYPKEVDIDLSKFTDFGNPFDEDEYEQRSSSVNFPSKFQATTPVYPKQVEIDKSRLSEFDIPIGDRELETGLVNFASKFKATTPVYPLHVKVDTSKLSEFDLPIETENVDLPIVNFASKFKATTPVYPKQVDVDLSKFSGSEEKAPEEPEEDKGLAKFASNFKATTPVYPQHVDVDLSKFSEPVELPEDTATINNTVNFASKFKATTPDYPQSVDATSPIPDKSGLLPPLLPAESKSGVNQIVDNHVQVNFASKFQATTPDYPKDVEATSPDPSNVGLLAPEPAVQASESLEPSLDIQPPSFYNTFKRRIDEEDPSVIGNTFSNKQLTEFMITIKPEQLKDLKQLWHIPEYDFPLDTASRPSYESDFSSFQAIPNKSIKSR